MASFKVGVKTPGDKDWSTNSWRFATRVGAERYGRDLASRWMAVEQWTVLPSEDEPNRESADR